MTLPFRESHDLVLERWAIPWPDALDLPIVERASANILLHQLTYARVRVQEPAGHPIANRTPRDERKTDRRCITPFLNEHSSLDVSIKVNAPSVQARRRPRLETTPSETKRLERFRKLA